MKPKEMCEWQPLLGSATKGKAISVLVVLALLAVWTAISSTGWVSALLLPSPIRVIRAARDIGFDLVVHFIATLIRVLVGFVLGVAFGVTLGVVMQYSRIAFLLLDGVVETARPVPAVALIPFFLLIFGFAESGKILLTVLGTGLILTVSSIEAIERVPAAVVRWGLVCGLSRIALFRHVILPAAFPELRSGTRVALALSITLVITSEFMGATRGLGYLINVAKTTLSTPTIVLAVIILGWLSWFLDRIVRCFFDKYTTWDIRAKGATR